MIEVRALPKTSCWTGVELREEDGWVMVLVGSGKEIHFCIPIEENFVVGTL